MDKLIVSNVSKTFADKQVLENVSITLREGELVSLLGVSGGGKSTLFNIISGLMKPDCGQVLLDGEDVTNRPGRISYMLQKDLLLPYRTIEDNVALPLLLRGMKKSEARAQAESHFAEFGLTGTEKKWPAQLSGGMRQRAALLRTYLFSQNVALLDEPFSALDSFLREQLITEMKSLLGSFQGDSIIVTHNRNEAYELCSSLAIMENGRLTETGNTRKIFSNAGTRAGAVLTGCKNIVGAEKTGEHEVRVPEWGISFFTEKAVRDDLAAIGIRAHYFGPDRMQNRFPVKITEQIEEPFAWIIKFRYGNQNAESESIWWRTDKGSYDPSSETGYLGVAPEDIMLLYDTEEEKHGKDRK